MNINLNPVEPLYVSQGDPIAIGVEGFGEAFGCKQYRDINFEVTNDNGVPIMHVTREPTITLQDRSASISTTFDVYIRLK